MILALLWLGCGLRRRELTELTIDHFQRREDHWAIVDLIGKGGHVRTIPVPSWVKGTVDDWLAASRIVNGRLFRCVRRMGTIWGTEMTEKVVWHVVKQYAGEGRNSKARTARSSKVMRSPLPQCRRRANKFNSF